jgi:hypothetical protein
MGIRDYQLDAPEAAFDQPFKKADQNGSASEGPMPSPVPGLDPGISRRPSVETAMAIIAATETMRPPSRTLR